MKKLTVVALIGLLLAAGLVLVGCSEKCPGSGGCTVTIAQGASGLYVDYDSPRSTCGKSATWSSSSSSYSGGCVVQNNMDGHSRSYGTKSCDCDVAGLF